jgi:tRNA threonylcarbamoyladenosine modification (KEOPS) complex  Pcc1 subunit
MNVPPDGWTGTVTVRVRDPRLAERLERALWPESAREVPRARARLDRAPDDTLTLSVDARDTGAMRAALNTYLGWVHLSLATARTVAPRPPDANAAGD